MKLKQHIEIGKGILENLDNKALNEFGINRTTYLLGCIAPDLNCVYPAHRLWTTEKRFNRRLRQVNKATAKLKFVKSFRLGIITHYTCDYFCYAHNNESVGVRHKMYEANLYQFYQSHLNELQNTSLRLQNIWLENKRKSITDNIKNDTITVKEQCEIITEQVARMNKEYSSETDINKNVGWETKIKQMQQDMEYAMFMSQHVIEMIIEPFKCVTTGV